MKLDKLFKKVFEMHWNIPRYIDSRYAYEVLRVYESKIKPHFGDMDTAKITKPLVREWHQSMADIKSEANKALGHLIAIYNLGLQEDLLEGGNPFLTIKKFTETKRSRRSGPEELKKLAEEFEKEKEKNPKIITYLLCLLFTGARPRSLQKITWDDIEPIENGFGVLTFQGKTSADSGEDERIILSPQVMQMLLNLPKRDDDLVFGPVSYRTLWGRIRKRVGCDDLWARDFRRTFASIGLSDGVQISTIGELLNHKNAATTKIYAKLDDSARIKAVGQISEKIASLLGRT